MDWIADPHPPPDSASLIRAVPLKNIDYGDVQLCHDNELIYFGFPMKQSIYIIDKNGASSEFVTLPDGNKIYRMTNMNDKLFVLTYDDWRVLVYSLKGEQIASWQINSYSLCSSIVTAGEKLVAACKPDLIVFDEEGRKHKTLSRVNLEGDIYNYSIFPVDSNSIIVVNFAYDNVKRIDIRTGELLWSNTDDISGPLSAVYDGHGNILVFDDIRDIYVLDVSTG